MLSLSPVLFPGLLAAHILNTIQNGSIFTLNEMKISEVLKDACLSIKLGNYCPSLWAPLATEPNHDANFLTPTPIHSYDSRERSIEIARN